MTADDANDERPKRPRRVIVTGASEGIGRGISEVLAEAGHRVGLVARRVEPLTEVVQGIGKRRGLACGATADVRDPRAIEATTGQLVEHLGGLDAVVVNAGIVPRESIVDISYETWRNVIDTNVHGAFHTIRAALPYFLDQRDGHVIAISSISGRLPLAPGSAYAASKHALHGLAESLFLELREYDIKVSVVSPGSVDTPSHRKEDDDPSWKITPREVGEACRSILETRRQNVVSRLEIRPLRRR